MISAEVICDSISPQGHRLTTMKLRYPKFIHGEFMTHRVFSRNASSSRAIPVAKLIAEVRDENLRAAPVFWGKNQAGMQAAEELNAKWTEHLTFPALRIGNTQGWEAGSSYDAALELWAIAAENAADLAEQMNKLGTHKQIVNRLLEPFSHINVVATATEFDNFFGLRLHAAAQPEMRALAEAMWAAREVSTPRTCEPGQWHLPFVDDETLAKISSLLAMGDENTLIPNSPIGRIKIEAAQAQATDIPIKVSVARCARVSYESFETGKRSTVEEDLKLYDRLLGAQPLHASPAEHQATPDTQNSWKHIDRASCPECEHETWDNEEEHGNFVGWRQYRKMLPNEAVAPLPEEYLPF